MLRIKKIITVFLSLFMVAVAAHGQSMKVVADKISAIVGDKIILYSDIKNAILDIQRQGGQVPENADCLIMEQALLSKVLMMQALKDSLPITEDEIEANLDNRIRRFINIYGTQQALEDIAGKTIYQIKDDSRDAIREQMLAEAMQKKIVENVRITPNEVKQFFERIPKDSLPFFESELEVGHIVVYPKATRDFELYIIDELNNYKKQIESKITTFDQLAKRYSEDPGSKDRGGQYQVNRNEKTWDPAFLAASFRLKEGEISGPVKTKFGYHIIQMVQRSGDEAIVKHILRIPPVTNEEIALSSAKLDSVRAKIIAGSIGFNEAALKYSEDDISKFAGPFILSSDGSPYVRIDELDKDIVAAISKMKVGDISQPQVFTDERNKKGVRIIYFKSRSEPHRMNLEDDYSKISQMALEEKKMQALEKWMKSNITTHYIMIDEQFSNNCPNLSKFIAIKAF
jgi:peptidyl-prolyl cis-trans isomerase SurA